MPGSNQTERTAKARLLPASAWITGPWRVNCSSTSRSALALDLRSSRVTDAHRLPAALVAVLVGVGGIELVDVEVFLVDAKMVRPKAMLPLWPIEMPGSAGSPAPIAEKPGASRVRRCSAATARRARGADRWRGSAGRSRCATAATTQLLEPMLSRCGRPRRGICRDRARARPCRSLARRRRRRAWRGRRPPAHPSGCCRDRGPRGPWSSSRLQLDAQRDRRRGRRRRRPRRARPRRRRCGSAPWLRMRTTSSAVHRSGMVPASLNSTGSGACPRARRRHRR